MKRIGLTGGIASGKSAVAGMLRELGFRVLDADSIGHKVIEPGNPGYSEVLREFGSEILDPSGKIDRGKLGRIVFAEGEKLNRLNGIVHPLVEQEMLKHFGDWEREGVRDPVFVEAALLVEAGYQKNLDGLVIAWCTPDQQLKRLKSRGLSEEEARRRIATQMPVEEKLKFATDRIDCSGTMEETRSQVRALAARLKGEK